MKQQQKILPFAEPVINVYPHHALALGILQNNIYDLPALFENYIQLVYDLGIDRMDFSYGLDILSYMKGIPLLFCHELDRGFVYYNWKEFSRFLINCINNEYYVHCLVDTYYIAAYEECYMKNHLYHNITIYGYNQKRNIFYTADSFVHGRFVKKEVSMSELNESFFNTRVNDWLDGILLYRVKEDPYKGIGYDTRHMRKEIRNYLDGIPSGEISVQEKRRRIPDQYVYGIQVYESLLTYLRYIRDEDEKINIRLISELADNKKVLFHIAGQLHSIALLDCVNENRENITGLHKELMAISGKMLKYNILHDIDLLNEIMENLQEVMEKDYNAMEFLYKTMLEIPKPYKLTPEIEDNFCIFVERDTASYGNWQKQYGSKGYHLIGLEKRLPDYLEEDNYIFRNSIYILLKRQYGEETALCLPGNREERMAAYYLNGEEFSIEFIFSDNKEHMITFYCMDYDMLERRQVVEAIDGATGECVHREELACFHYGVYLKFRLKGHIYVKFRRLEGSDAVLSGVFFD